MDRDKNSIARAVEVFNVWLLKRGQQDGIEGLVNKPKSGRSAKASEAYGQALERLLEQEPKELGYVFAMWPRPMIDFDLE